MGTIRKFFLKFDNHTVCMRFSIAQDGNSSVVLFLHKVHLGIQVVYISKDFFHLFSDVLGACSATLHLKTTIAVENKIPTSVIGFVVTKITPLAPREP